MALTGYTALPAEVCGSIDSDDSIFRLKSIKKFDFPAASGTIPDPIFFSYLI